MSFRLPVCSLRQVIHHFTCRRLQTDSRKLVLIKFYGQRTFQSFIINHGSASSIFNGIISIKLFFNQYSNVTSLKVWFIQKLENVYTYVCVLGVAALSKVGHFSFSWVNILCSTYPKCYAITPMHISPWNVSWKMHDNVQI
jgi:hypothetical protein